VVLAEVAARTADIGASLPTRPELNAVQHCGDGRSPAAVNAVVGNLRNMGYIRAATRRGSEGFEITEKGLQALALTGQAPDYSPRRTAAPAVLVEPEPHDEVPTRAVPYGAGTVRVPIAPRWVFDLERSAP
jgi:hypothetical protein